MPQALPRKTALAFGIKQLDNKFQYDEQTKPAPITGAGFSSFFEVIQKPWNGTGKRVPSQRKDGTDGFQLRRLWC
jgi:hypothetical protein